MKYMIRGFDVPDSLSARRAVRAEHLARLEVLRDAGRLLIAGPLPAIDSADPGPAGFVGSVLIADFASLEEARAWAEADPYISAGAWSRAEVHPFLQVFP